MPGPIAQWKNKGLQLAAWEGRTGPTFSISKRYKDKNTGEWKESKSLFKEDLVALGNLIQEANLWMATGETQERGAQSMSEIVAKVQKAIPSVKVEDIDDIPF